jgi:hypothetical protein
MRGSASSSERARELSELARDTRILADEIAQGLRSNPERLNMPTIMTAILRGLRNQEAILEALARLSETPPPRTAPARLDQRSDLEGDSLEIEPEPRTQEPLAIPRELDRPPRDERTVSGDRAREIVEEFDNRGDFDRGLTKLNSWLSSGAHGLPFQKRDGHAYLNTRSLSEAMLARIEAELSGREGYAVRLGRLVVEGLSGEVVIFARSSGPGER